MISRLASTLAALVLALGAGGCGGGREALEKELAELRAELSRVRAAEAALTQRLDTIEADRAAAAKGPTPLRPPGAPPPAPLAARDGERPELDVVRLSPSEGDGDVDNDPSRPVIKAAGEAGRQTLNNRTISTHPSKKAVTVLPQKKDGGDARPSVKP